MADKSARPWRTTLKRRLFVAFGVLLVWTLAIEARLVYLQVYSHEWLWREAQRQQLRVQDLAARRGVITDRNGHILALSVELDSIFVDPTVVGDFDAVAATLCEALDDCDAAEQASMAARFRSAFERDKLFAYVRRRVTPAESERVRALRLRGVGFHTEDQRRYPGGELAAHLLGSVGTENAGLGGIEAAYNSRILGEPGKLVVQTDGEGRVFGRAERPPTTGASVELTIDSSLQHVVERELRAGVEWSGAAAGSVVVMSPATGEILAMASYPGFDPNAYGSASGARRRNRAVQDYYEPGSTFKIVTASAALEEGAVTPATVVDASQGHIQIGRRRIDDDHNYGVLSFADVIVRSSNVGAIKVALDLGPETMAGYVSRFGFGREASQDFEGENPGMVWDASTLNDSALASVAMGYQVGVTPLQMAQAVSVVANGGELIEPRVVRALIRDGVRTPQAPAVRERVISASTAATLTRIMEQVVERGTGTEARIPGYPVAGKTGTAAKLVNGSYVGHREYNVSFVGFAPADRPALAIVVVVDTPRKVSPYGGVVAAPIFRRIATAALGRYGIPRSQNPPAPLLAGRWDDGAGEPAPTPVIVRGEPSGVRQGDVLPDLTGLSARDALRRLGRLGVAAIPRGFGVVTAQVPLPGTPLRAGTTVQLTLGRQVPGAGRAGGL